MLGSRILIPLGRCVTGAGGIEEQASQMNEGMGGSSRRVIAALTPVKTNSASWLGPWGKGERMYSALKSLPTNAHTLNATRLDGMGYSSPHVLRCPTPIRPPFVSSNIKIFFHTPR